MNTQNGDMSNAELTGVSDACDSAQSLANSDNTQDFANQDNAQKCITNDEKTISAPLQLSVFRQSEISWDYGEKGIYTIYRGEDARPYVGDGILLVADGLGGSGAMRHQNFNKDMFDADKLPYLIFDGMDSEEYADLRAYISDSFFELISVKDVYYDKAANLKKSGYFGSRVAAAVFLKFIMDNAERFLGGKIFSEIKNCDSTEEKLAELEALFTGAVKDGMETVAKRCNLYYESRMSGLMLLATTLTATLFCEDEHGVDTLTLSAGDSRPYVWDENGLRQTMQDQEGADGGMTNCISLTAKFRIIPSYRRFDKPCILFNTSDGCFDSYKFDNSQMAFEKMLLEAIVNNESIDGAEREIYDFFVVNGTHDDSSTIALRAFGYESYDALREAAERRLKVIEGTYIAKMPELLDVNYRKDVDSINREAASRYRQAKEKLALLDEVKAYCTDKVLSGSWEPYNTALAALEADLTNQSAKSTSLDKTAREIIARHAVLIAYSMKLGDACAVSSEDKKRADAFITEINALPEDFKSGFSELREKINEKISGTFNSMIDYALTLKNPLEFKDNPVFNSFEIAQVSEIAEEISKKWTTMLKNLSKSANRDKNYGLPYVQKIREYECFNKTTVKKEAVDIILSEMLKGGFTFSIDCSAFDDDINTLLDIIPSLRDMGRVDSKAKRALIESEAAAYFNAHAREITDSILAGGEPCIDAASADEIRRIFSVEHKLAELTAKMKEQEELLSSYDAVYYSLIRAQI